MSKEATNIDIEADPTSVNPPPPPPQQNVRWIPWLVPVFVMANFCMFVITMYVNDCPKNSESCWLRFLGRFSFQPRSENWLLGPSSIILDKMGALDVSKVVHEKQGWRLITCNWLHAGVLHILANMSGLLFIGIRLEQDFGFTRIGPLYVISGFGGSLMSSLFLRSNISVGASGAIFGLVGSMLSDILTNWTIYVNKFAILSALVLVVMINFAFGLLPHVDNFAHIGGFVSGFLLGFVFLIRPQFEWLRREWLRRQIATEYHAGPAKPKHKMYQYILCIIASILLIAWFAIGMVMLFRGVDANDHCSWCHYL